MLKNKIYLSYKTKLYLCYKTKLHYKKKYLYITQEHSDLN